MANESDFWSKVERGVPTDIRATRIECISPPGIPDVEWHGAGCGNRSGWIELKDEDIWIRPEQRNLGRKWRKDGVNICLMARKDGRLYLIDPLEIPLNGNVNTVLRGATPGLGTSPMSHCPMPKGKDEWAVVWDKVMLGPNNWGARP